MRVIDITPREPKDGQRSLGWNSIHVPPLPVTEWPTKNRKPHFVSQPEERNVGGKLFRRYPDGTLDYIGAKAIIREAFHKANIGIALTENESAAIGLVFPSLRFADMTQERMKQRANLSDEEALTLRSELMEESRQNGGRW